MRVSVSVLRIVAIVWMAIAVVLALVLVISLSGPVYVQYLFPGTEQLILVTPGISWELSLLMFFVFLLILTLPACLLLYLWRRLSWPKR